MVRETNQGLLVEPPLGRAIVFLTEANCTVQCVGTSIRRVRRGEGYFGRIVADIEVESYIIAGFRVLSFGKALIDVNSRSSEGKLLVQDEPVKTNSREISRG